MLIKQSTAKRLPFRLVDETDGTTAEPGLAGAAVVTVSKNGGAFGASAGTITEVSAGRYYYTPTTTETNTLGYLEYRVICTGCRETSGLVQIVAYDPEDGAALGLTAFATLATAAALAASDGKLDTLIARLTAQRASNLDNLDAAITSRAATGAQMALTGGAITAVQTGLAQSSEVDTLEASMATMLSRLTSDRATLLDNLGAGGADPLATAAALVALAARLPAALVGGRMDVSVGAMQPNTMNAAALAADAGTELAAAIAAAVPTAAENGAAVWADATGVDVVARIASILPSYFVDDTIVRNSDDLPTSCRRRFYANATHRDAATTTSLTGNEVAVVTMNFTYSASLLTRQVGVVAA